MPENRCYTIVFEDAVYSFVRAQGADITDENFLDHIRKVRAQQGERVHRLEVDGRSGRGERGVGLGCGLATREGRDGDSDEQKAK